MLQQSAIVLGWRAMRAVRCKSCGGWGLTGPCGGYHLSGRVAPPAVCLGLDYWLEGQTPLPPPEHRRPWWENVPPSLRPEGIVRPPGPPPHGQAWDYLPPAPVEGCSCGYYLSWWWRPALRLVRRFRNPLLLYCQAAGSAIVDKDGARVESFRVLGYAAQAPDLGRWCSLAAPKAAETVMARWGPEIPDPDHLPTGVFDHLPPEAAALLS